MMTLSTRSISGCRLLNEVPRPVGIGSGGSGSHWRESTWLRVKTKRTRPLGAGGSAPKTDARQAVPRPQPTPTEPDAYERGAGSRLSPDPGCRRMTARPRIRVARPRVRLLPGTDRRGAPQPLPQISSLRGTARWASRLNTRRRSRALRVARARDVDREQRCR